MALGDSAVSICNIGLIALGEDPIVSLQDNRKAAILCAARYDQLRRATLRSAPWNCAKKQAQLAASTTAPLFTYSASYPLPADCLRVLDLPENDLASWEIVGTNLLTDEDAPLDILYVYDLTDPTRMDPLLCEAIGYAIGAEFAQPLKQSSALETVLKSRLEDRIAAARLASSQENSPKEWDEDVWLRSRR